MDKEQNTMPMIDVYATAGTFTDPHQLTVDLARTLMTIEGVPDIPMFRRKAAAFVHALPDDAMSNVDGESTYVRVQVLTNAGALDRDKQLAVVSQFTELVADAAHDPALAARTWVLLTEAVPGGWGLGGHANTNDELVAAARKQIAELQAKAGGPTSYPSGQRRVEQGGRGGAGRGGRGRVVVHPRGLPAAVVEQVQLAGQDVGRGHADAGGQLGQQRAHPVAVALGGLLDQVAGMRLRAGPGKRAAAVVRLGEQLTLAFEHG